MGVCDSAEAAAVSGHLGPAPRQSNRVGILEQTGLWVRTSCPACPQFVSDFSAGEAANGLQGLFQHAFFEIFMFILWSAASFLGGIFLTCKAVL